MRFARARDVPFCAAISGLVFLALFMNLGEPIHLVYILAGYGVVYLVEWYLRSRAAALSGTPPADPSPG
jgi:hypothetical protein